MSCKSTTALAALLVICFSPVALADTGNWASNHRASVKRPASTVSKRPAGAVNDPTRTSTADKGTFVASPLVPRSGFGRDGSAGKAKSWIKLTAPGGESVHINVEQITSVRPDTEMSEANTQLDLASGKFQRVREDVDEVMQLISPPSDARENDDRPNVALFCAIAIGSPLSSRASLLDSEPAMDHSAGM